MGLIVTNFHQPELFLVNCAMFLYLLPFTIAAKIARPSIISQIPEFHKQLIL